jgi:hypothetical protein
MKNGAKTTTQIIDIKTIDGRTYEIIGVFIAGVQVKTMKRRLITNYINR